MAPKTKSHEPSMDIVLGIDYGERNIGLAFGRNNLVTPLKNIPGANEPTAIAEIVRIVMENKVSKIVIGIPLTYDNKDTPKARKVRLFSKRLKISLKMPVVFVNEYKSTEESMENAVSFGVPKKGRENIDHISAGVILKRYYEELSG